MPRKPVTKKAIVKPPVIPVQKVKPILDIESIPAMKKEKLFLVRAEVSYNNGQICGPWRAGEQRLVNADVLNKLFNDLPNNWTVIDG